MTAYSTDLRVRVVAACDARDGTRDQIAARFSVSASWVRKILRQRRDSGSIEPRPHGGGRAPAFDDAAAARLRGPHAPGGAPPPPLPPPRPPPASATPSRPTMTPPWRRWPGPPAWRAASRPSSGRWTAWASREKKVAAGGRAGPAGAEGRAPGVARGVRRDRPG